MLSEQATLMRIIDDLSEVIRRLGRLDRFSVQTDTLEEYITAAHANASDARAIAEEQLEELEEGA